ncbi:hypothetical protein XENORESO_001591, partial [Xenotaenia resolanae]
MVRAEDRGRDEEREGAVSNDRGGGESSQSSHLSFLRRSSPRPSQSHKLPGATREEFPLSTWTYTHSRSDTEELSQPTLCSIFRRRFPCQRPFSLRLEKMLLFLLPAFALLLSTETAVYGISHEKWPSTVAQYNKDRSWNRFRD